MLIGIPKEVKDFEYRVSLTPDGARLLRQQGHQVLVEPSAGQGSGFSDEAYRQAGLQAWAEYQATGQHVTHAEADAWLAKLEAGDAAEAPECHD